MNNLKKTASVSVVLGAACVLTLPANAVTEIVSANGLEAIQLIRRAIGDGSGNITQGDGGYLVTFNDTWNKWNKSGKSSSQS